MCSLQSPVNCNIYRDILQNSYQDSEGKLCGSGIICSSSGTRAFRHRDDTLLELTAISIGKCSPYKLMRCFCPACCLDVQCACWNLSAFGVIGTSEFSKFGINFVKVVEYENR